MSLPIILALHLFVLLDAATTSTWANQTLEAQAKEWVVDIARKVVENHQRRMGSDCKMDCKSYRLACQPLPLDLPDSRDGCFGLPETNHLFFNDTCELSGDHPKCIEAQMFMGSYIWLPWWIELRSRTEDSRLQHTLKESLKGMSCEQKRTLCSQMELDEIFGSKYQSPLNLTKFAWSMFGASNGIFRIYPGLELSKTTCDKPFDPRKRPWYKIHTAVKKEVVVLLDTSEKMSSDELESPWESKVKTTLEASKLMVKDFLDTLTAQDRVWIYTFNESEPVKIPETPYDVKVYRSDELEKDLEKLKETIDNITVPVQTGNFIGANLTKALLHVLNEPGPLNRSGYSETRLKMLLIIAGQKVGAPLPSSFLQAELSRKKIRTFISQWEPTDLERKIGYEDISEDACRIKASYITIARATYLTDHLAGLQPYYNYLAKLKHNLSNGSEVVRNYKSYSSIGPVKSISFPAFDGENFIGVASVDISEYFDGTTDDSWEAPENTSDPENCKDLQPLESCPELSTLSNNFDCNYDRLDGRSYDKRTCCSKGCKSSNLAIVLPPIPSTADPPRENSTNAVLIAAPIGAATILILAFVAGWLCWKKTSSGSGSAFGIREPISNGMVDSPNSSPTPLTWSAQTNFNDRL